VRGGGCEVSWWGGVGSLAGGSKSDGLVGEGGVGSLAGVGVSDSVLSMEGGGSEIKAS
jgi:hypothetical protein